MGWLLNNRNLFLTIVGAGKSKFKVLADPMSHETYLCVQRRLSSRCVLMGQKREGSSVRFLFFLIRALIPFIRPPVS